MSPQPTLEVHPVSRKLPGRGGEPAGWASKARSWYLCSVADGREEPCACPEAMWVLDGPGGEVRLVWGMVGPSCRPMMGLAPHSLVTET